MDRGDRRNTVFGTKNTHEAKAHARDFYVLTSKQKSLAWQGMAEFLASIKIDDAFISHAYDTKMKERMIENNVNPVEEWLLSDDVLKMWPVNHFAPTDWLYPHYKNWMRQVDGYEGQINKKYFHRMMIELHDMGLVSEPCRKTLKGDKKHRGYIRYDSDEPHNNLRITDHPFVPEYQKSAALIEMRDNIRSKTNLKLVS